MSVGRSIILLTSQLANAFIAAPNIISSSQILRKHGVEGVSEIRGEGRLFLLAYLLFLT